MALDGAFLHQLKKEISGRALGARAEKIYQPARDELVVLLRGRGFSGRLLLSASPTAARVHFTEFAPENPAVPPMFCMLLRKYLGGAKLTDISQPGLERLLRFHFETVNELGDPVSLSLVVELIGRQSNLILLDHDGRIIDAARRVDIENSTRLIQPGARYELPEPQGKLNLPETSAEEVLSALRLQPPDTELSAALLRTLDGASPIVCRELAFSAGRGEELRVAGLSQEVSTRLLVALKRLSQSMKEGGTPTLVLRPDGSPLDFTYIPVSQYGMAAVTRELPDYSALLDSFYAEREKAARLKRHSQDLLKLLTTLSQRIARKINAQKADLARCEGRETLRIYGELLKANLHAVPKGASFAEVDNYYDPEMKKLRIPLNTALSPAQNAQRYFKEYKKTYTAEQTLTGLIEKSEEELNYIDSIFDALTRAESDQELEEIRAELESVGYLKGARSGAKKTVASAPLQFVSSDGFTILVGRNNRQNDQLTLHEAAKDDIWLHTKNIPGSHVIIRCDGRPVPDRTLEEAAVLAAYHSKARLSAAVPVDYTSVRKVKKPSGAKPGMVIYEGNSTAYVNPDSALVARLSENSAARRA